MIANPFTRFLADDVNRDIAPIDYVGSATSHFQAEPFVYDENSHVLISSDWEFDAQRQMKGMKSGIPKADFENLPQFLKKKELYIKRSAELSENMFRFSLDPARLCPGPTDFNEALMTEYVKTAALTRRYGLEPFVTLNHFTMPKYLVTFDRDGMIDRGAWQHREVISHVRFYVENVMRFLANRDKLRAALDQLAIAGPLREEILSSGLIRYFLTINEPAVVLVNGYGLGNFPPYRHWRLLSAIRVFKQLQEAHRVMSSATRELVGDGAQIGVGHNWQYFDGIGGRLLHLVQEFCTEAFERDAQATDFLGLHYYFRRTIPATRKEKDSRDYSDQPTFGDVFPAGISWVMKKMHARHPQKPVFISEIGFSDRTDLRRPFWLLETLRHILTARSEGVAVKGILHWSLVSNFEWDYGMAQKFGLFDEADLEEPLNFTGQTLRGWQVWLGAVRALRKPCPESLRKLDLLYARAHRQYIEAGHLA